MLQKHIVPCDFFRGGGVYNLARFNNCIPYRHPNKNLRPSFSDLHTSLSDHALSLQMKETAESGHSNQAYITHTEAKHAGAMECIETDANMAYITQSEAGAMECIETDANQAYITSSEAQQEYCDAGTMEIHPQAHTIGAPLEAGKELFTDLQNTYLNE